MRKTGRRLTKIEEDIAGNPQRTGRKVLIDVTRLAVLTGLRRGEICNLRWDGVWIYDPPKQSHAGLRLYGWINVSSREGALTKTGMRTACRWSLRNMSSCAPCANKREERLCFRIASYEQELNAWW